MLIKELPDNPHEFPYVDPQRLLEMDRIPMPADASKIEFEMAQDYAEEEAIIMKRIMGRTGIRASFDTNEQWGALADVPIAVLDEPPERVARTIASIGRAADQLEDPTFLTGWLNFHIDQRRRVEDAKRAEVQKSEIRDAILDASRGHNLIPDIAFDVLPQGLTISGIRQRMLLGKLGCALASPFAEKAIQLPYLSVDADSEITPSTLVRAKKVLDTGKALFVNGTLHYVGEVMDMPLNEVEYQEPAIKSLYIVEHMRRLMIDNLPPTSSRGYLSETGLVTRLATLVEAGGFNLDAENNESYWLEYTAKQALESYIARENKGEYPTRQSHEDPCLPDFVLSRLHSISRYEEYMVTTSIEGVAKNVRRNGNGAVVEFDQGENYTMRVSSKKLPPREEIPTYARQDVLNSAYSYYKDIGGTLTAEGLLELDALLEKINMYPVKVEGGQLGWMPRYYPRALRAIIQPVDPSRKRGR